MSVPYIKSTSELQELFNANTYVAIDYTASWCGPCKQVSPIYESLASKHAIPGQLALVKVDVDAAQDIARTYNVTAMPTFMFFKEGKQVAVNGQALIRGADVRSLNAAVEKLSGLAKKRQEEAAEA